MDTSNTMTQIDETQRQINSPIDNKFSSLEDVRAFLDKDDPPFLDSHLKGLFYEYDCFLFSISFRIPNNDRYIQNSIEIRTEIDALGRRISEITEKIDLHGVCRNNK